jgi:pimeloyl-ACP methyl ester carboxylesterase
MPEFVSFHVAPNAANKAAIIFVHGFTGDAAKTWRRIPEFLAPALSQWDLLGFGYRSGKLFDLVGLWSADAQLEEIATMLQSRPEIAASRYDTLCLVAHSMGGLVVQRALVKYPDLRARTSHVILFGTPSRGLVKARLLSFWKRQVNNMAARGPFIAQLRADWQTTVLDAAPPPFRFTAVAGEMDQFVPPESSLGPFPEELRRVIPGNHVTMLDAQSASDPCVQIIEQVISQGAAGTGPRNNAKVAIEAGKFQQLIKRLWPERGQPNAPLPAGLDDDAAVQLAIALEQVGLREDAIRILTAHKDPGTDVLGVLAGRLKRRWWVQRKAEDLQRAQELYQSGYDQAVAKEDHDQALYHGINLAYLAVAGARDFSTASATAERVVQHCENAKDPGRRQWVLPTQGDALTLLGKIKEGFEKHQASAAQDLEPWEAQSMEEQAVRMADLCGVKKREIQRLADLYEGRA